MIKNIAVLAGDGIGPEVMKEAIKVLDVIAFKTGVTFNYTNALVGASAIDSENNPFPDSTKLICKSSDAILFGAIGDPKYDNNPKAKIRPEDGLLEMRKFLGLYANVRPVKTYNSLIDASPLKREIIEGENVDERVITEVLCWLALRYDKIQIPVPMCVDRNKKAQLSEDCIGECSESTGAVANPY